MWRLQKYVAELLKEQMNEGSRVSYRIITTKGSSFSPPNTELLVASI